MTVEIAAATFEAPSFTPQARDFAREFVAAFVSGYEVVKISTKDRQERDHDVTQFLYSNLEGAAGRLTRERILRLVKLGLAAERAYNTEEED